MKFAAFLASTVGLATLVGCGKTDTASHPFADPNVVATVGEGRLTKADFEEFARHRRVENAEQREAALQALIDEEALAQEARSRGLHESPKFRAALRRMLASQVLEEAEGPAGLSDEALREAYEKMGQQFATPGRREVAVLRRSFADETERTAAQARLEEARTVALAARATERGFGSLAATESDDTDTRYQGGLAGWIVDGQKHPTLAQEVIAAAERLNASGDLSPVVETRAAFFLVKLIAREAPGRRPFAQVKEALRLRLEANSERNARQERIHAVRSDHRIEIDPSRVEGLPRELDEAPSTMAAHENLGEFTPR